MPTPAVPLFDAAQLHRRTQGNASLQAEMLALFLTEVERLMRQVEDAPDPQLRGERLRALIGVARNIGAARVAHEARALETEIASETPDASALKAAVEETLAFIRRTGG